jgi:hypothetical protein
MIYISPEDLVRLNRLRYDHYLGPVRGEGIAQPNNAVHRITNQARREVVTLGYISPLTRLKTSAVLDSIDNRN